MHTKGVRHLLRGKTESAQIPKFYFFKLKIFIFELEIQYQPKPPRAFLIPDTKVFIVSSAYMARHIKAYNRTSCPWSVNDSKQ